jgi:2-C-methyl-D-erythritol 2,4-cyclodiphosphate synthase
MNIDFRIGQGFDVHAFGDGDHVMLGGVRVPHERGMLAHSDGDVVLHACATRSSARWRWATSACISRRPTRAGRRDSRALLRHCDGLMAARGWRSAMRHHRDLRATQGRPACHGDARSDRGDLGIDIDRVSVKATTTEKLGFTGRGEGIAAQAVCLLVRA